MVDKEEVLRQHMLHKGKVEIVPKVALNSMEDLSIYYTPGVAYASLEINKDKSKVYDYTTKANTIAIVSDGTRILGLGNVGPEAGMPVMEGKAALFKKFGGVDAIPICINAKNEDEIVRFVEQLAPTVGGINIEDISSPTSFNVVERLSNSLEIPIFHDDQFGTATIVLAGLINALKLTSKSLQESKIVINGAGSAGIGISKLLNAAGAKNIYVIDSKGAIYEGRQEGMNFAKEEIAKFTNKERVKGNITDIAIGADVLIGVSNKGAFTKDIIKRMAEKQIVFALANPEPEISYSDAKEAGAFIVATGRSDTPNQVNNLVAFPGIMRGLLDSRAKKVTMNILLEAAKAIAKSVGKDLSTEYIVPSFTSSKNAAMKISPLVAAAVVRAAQKDGVARINVEEADEKKNVKNMLKRYAKIEKKLAGITP